MLNDNLFAQRTHFIRRAGLAKLAVTKTKDSDSRHKKSFKNLVVELGSVRRKFYTVYQRFISSHTPY